jgi:hypothetical protein
MSHLGREHGATAISSIPSQISFLLEVILRISHHFIQNKPDQTSSQDNVWQPASIHCHGENLNIYPDVPQSSILLTGSEPVRDWKKALQPLIHLPIERWVPGNER